MAVPCHDLAVSKAFYTEVIGCSIGRTDTHWIDLNLFGHQFVLHYNGGEKIKHHRNDVDGKSVPVPHYGVVLSMEEWDQLKNRLLQAKVDFIIEPYIRFEGQPGEQATMFFLDPTGNALEFKAFKNIGQLFTK